MKAPFLNTLPLILLLFCDTLASVAYPISLLSRPIGVFIALVALLAMPLGCIPALRARIWNHRRIICIVSSPALIFCLVKIIIFWRAVSCN